MNTIRLLIWGQEGNGRGRDRLAFSNVTKTPTQSVVPFKVFDLADVQAFEIVYAVGSPLLTDIQVQYFLDGRKLTGKVADKGWSGIRKCDGMYERTASQTLQHKLFFAELVSSTPIT